MPVQADFPAPRIPRSPLSQPSPEQIAREIRNGLAAQAADRAWRRSVWRALGLAFLSIVIANLIGALGWMVGDDELGWILVLAGEAGVVLFPFLVLVAWVFEAHRRGDL